MVKIKSCTQELDFWPLTCQLLQMLRICTRQGFSSLASMKLLKKRLIGIATHGASVNIASGGGGKPSTMGILDVVHGTSYDGT